MTSLSGEGKGAPEGGAVEIWTGWGGRFRCPDCRADLVKTGFLSIFDVRMRATVRILPELGPVEGWKEISVGRDHACPIEIDQCFCEGCNAEVTQVVNDLLGEMWRRVGAVEDRPAEKAEGG